MENDIPKLSVLLITDVQHFLCLYLFAVREFLLWHRAIFWPTSYELGYCLNVHLHEFLPITDRDRSFTWKRDKHLRFWNTENGFHEFYKGNDKHLES